MSTIAIVCLAALGGGVGAALRFMVDTQITSRWRRDFPMGTFLVNVSGSLLLGVVMGLMLSGVPATSATESSATAAGAAYAGWSALLATGVLGGYTTFSTASLDAVRLARAGRVGVAMAYAVGTMAATVCAALAGLWLTL